MHVHPALAHFPVALLTVSAILGVLARSNRELVAVSWWTWVIGAFASLPVVVAGMIDHFPFEGSAVSTALDRHQFLGLGTAIAACSLAAWRGKRRRRGEDPVPDRVGYLVATCVVAGVVVITSWTGGLLVFEHGVNVSEITVPLLER